MAAFLAVAASSAVQAAAGSTAVLVGVAEHSLLLVDPLVVTGMHRLAVGLRLAAAETGQ